MGDVVPAVCRADVAHHPLKVVHDRFCAKNAVDAALGTLVANSVRYDLQSCVRHIDSVHRGHHTAFFRDTDDRRWRHNDSVVVVTTVPIAQTR